MKKTTEDFNMTVGQLLDFIEENNIPYNSKIFYERIEDFYFDKNNWKTYNKPDGDNPGHERKYVGVFTPVFYYDDNNLFLTAHY